MELSGIAPRTPVLCRWVDIHSECTWKSPDDLIEPPIIQTIGFFIGTKVFHLKDCLILAGSIGDDEISNTDIIPIGTIISLEPLNE